jgi:hypothetical protein
MPAVLEAPPNISDDEVELASALPMDMQETRDRGAAEHRLLVDCSIRGSTHSPGTDSEPRCPGLSLDGSPCNDVTAG